MPADRTKSWSNSEMSCNQLVWTAPVAAAPYYPEPIESTASITEIDFDDDGPPPLVDAPPLGFPPPPGEFILFPPNEFSEEKSGPKRVPHSKKKPENHIPRPPNAFILFRSSFIKAQHVDQKVETNHSTLSKIVGITWKKMSDAERKIWHDKAKKEQEEHRRKFPGYAFRPQQTKSKGGTGAKRKVREVEPKDLKRCEKIAELLVQGKKGNDLSAEIAEFDKHHVPEIVTRFEAPITETTFRRPSSAPIPDTELTIQQQSFFPKESTPAPRKARSVSARPTRCPTPVVEDVPEVPSHTSIEVQPSPLKQEAAFDFSAFSFDNVGSPAQNFPCDPLTETFATTPVFEQGLTIDTSFMSSDWSQCSSPVTPDAEFLATPSPSPSFAASPADPFGHAFEKTFGDYAQVYPVYQEQTANGLCNDAFLSMGADYTTFVNPSMQQLGNFGMESYAAFNAIPQYAF